MNIIGESQTGTIINGTNTNWVFHVGYNINVTITNLTLTNGNASEGSDIYNCGNLTLTDCTLTHNYASRVGAISSEGNLAATNCTFTDNTASVGGAIGSAGVSTGLSGCTFTNNTAIIGGAICSDGTTTISGCTFTNNTATDYGGAIYNSGTLTAKYNRFYNNTATNGNAIYCSSVFGGSVNADYNWWGSNSNPKSITNQIGGDVNTVNIDSWLFMTVSATRSTIYNGQSSEITVSFNNYSSDGVTYTSLPQPLEGYIPDGTPVIFSNTPGSFNPENPVTSSGDAATTFIPSCHSGTATVYATVDGFSLSTPITVTNSNIYVSNSTGSDTTGDGSQSKPYQTISKGISMITSGGTVHIADGIYTGTGNTNLKINKNMNIIGQSQTGTIINGTGTNWIFDVYGGTDVTFTNLTLTNGKAGLTDMYGYVHVGGAIYNRGTLSVNGCTFTGNNADYGGAIYNNGGTINSVSDCTFTGNTVISGGGDGGAILNVGTINSLNGCTFTGNTAVNGGGVINNVGTISLSGCNFTDNTATSGGVINNFGGTISLSGCNFTNNTATSGGAIYNGYYYLSDSKVTLNGCNITQNTATTYGGAIYNEGSLTANYNRFYNNTATDGTAIYSSRGSVNANYNWWSSNLNPKNIDKLIYDPGNLVDVTYWVILTVTAAPSSIKNTQTSIITANLNHYTDSGGNIGTFTDHIPDVPLTFAVDTNGNLDSLSGIISNGLNAATTFTAARKGLATVNAVVDEFTCSTAITITNNPPAVPNYDVTTQEDTSTSSTVDGNDVDTEDVLSYSVTKNPSHGTLTSFNPNTGAWTYMPGRDYNGDDSFEVTVSDSLATAISKVTIHVTAVNDDPVTSDDSQTINEDTTATGKVTATDIDGDSLTYAKGNDPAHGTITVNNDGDWIYTPSANWHGTDSFTVTVNEGNGGFATSTVTITVNPVNDAPTAVNDSATTNEDCSVDIDVLSNDTDVDTGDSLSINSFTQPDNGTTSLVGGKIRYTPNPNWYGTDTFTYTTRDGSGAISNIATVTIIVNPVNDAPTVGNYSSTTQEDTPTSGTVIGSDVDSSLTYSLGTQASHGTVIVNPDGTWTYTPNANYNGQDSFTVIVSDGTLTATSTITITINPVNDIPVANNDSKIIDEDHTTTGQITATDADKDTLTYTKDTNPAHGTATVNNNGTWTYTPEANYHGTDSFKVLVNDSNGGTAVSTVFITVNSVNDIPVAQNDTAATKEGKATNINVLSNDSDADGDSLTVNGVTQPVHGTATINADGTLTYTPNSNWYGSDSFSYTISDGNGGTATATVTITVNQAVSDLYIKTTSSSQNPTVGDTFTLTYKLGNNGPDEAKNVTITFQLPEGLNFVNIHVDSGKCTYNEITRTVTWTLDSVPVGDPYLYLAVQAAGDGTYNITPDIISDTYNTNTGDNGNITINVQPNNNNNRNSDNENTVKAASKTTIGLQDTGLPLNYLLLAVLMVLSGLVPKRR